MTALKATFGFLTCARGVLPPPTYHSIMRPLPLIASVASLALLAGCTSSTTAPETSSPAPVESASEPGEVASQAVAAADVEPWRAGTVTGSDASGPSRPTVWPAGRVVGSGSSTSLTPTLEAPGLSGQIDVEIVDMSQGGGFGADGLGEATEVVWTGQGKAESTSVPEGSLRQGATYAWRALRDNKVIGGPWAFAVDAIRAQTAPVDSLGGVSVNLLSGLVSTRWNGPSFTGASGGLVMALQYQPSLNADATPFPGLPAGWSWTLPGTGLIALQESEITSGSGDLAGPASVVLLDAQGNGQTFVRTESGSYAPGLSDGTTTAYGAAGTLLRVTEGTWQFIAPDGTLTRFESGRAVSEWTGGVPTVNYTWDADGRLTSLGDGISRTMTLAYGGQGDCPASAWGQGFTVEPGLWCATTNPDGTVTSVGYSGKQIGLIADAGGVSAGFGWDADGRLSAVRGSGAAAAAATTGGDWATGELTTQIAYDGDGRVESLTQPAVRPGADRVRRSYTYPAGGGDELTVSATQEILSGGAARKVASTLGDGVVLGVTAEADSWKVLSRRGADGRATKVSYDDESGVLGRGTDETGRTMQMRTDSDSIMTETVGPFMGSPDGAMRTQRFLDTTLESPEAGAASATTPWNGLAAMTWANGAGEPQWWNEQTLGDSLSGEVGASGSWNAVATGVWKVRDGGTWSLTAESSDNVTADVTINGIRCSSAARESCTLRLRQGDNAISVSLIGTDPGSFRVLAALQDKDASAIPMRDLRPGYQSATYIGVNDIVDGRNVGEQVITTSRPWTTAAESIRGSGGLVTQFAYEPTNPTEGSWGRPTRTTTPGGATLDLAYYGNTQEATDPCTGGSYMQAGQVKSQVRYDGVSITTVYDNRGNPVAVTQTGDGGKTQQTCTAYDAAGRPVSATVTGLDGTVLSSTSITRQWRDGVLTAVTTATTPAGTFTTTTVSDILQQVISHTDAWGVVTDFTVDAEGTVVRRVTRLPNSDSPALDIQYAFDKGTGDLRSISANGTQLATVTYEESGLLTQVTYAGDVDVAYSYAGSGAATDLTLSAKGTTVTQSRTRNAAGRTLSTSLDLAVEKKDVLTSDWEYTYDDAGRLIDAVLKSQGQTAVVGGDKRRFGYSYSSPEDCPTSAGADFNRTGGSRDGVNFVTCYDKRARMSSTTDPHLVAQGKAEASYDALGRLVSLTGEVPLEITWGAGTQPTRIAQGDDVAELNAAGGALIEYRVNGTATRLSYSTPAATAPALLLDQDGTVTTMLVTLPGGAVARLDGSSALTRIDHTDLFSAELLSTGPDGSPLGEGVSALSPRYGPYGEPLVPTKQPAGAAEYGWQAGPGNPTIGGWHDLTLSARPYHPWLGQFLAFDPSIGASSTGYGYGDGNPIDRTDYSGNSSLFEWMGIGGAVLAAAAGVAAGAVKQGPSKAFKAVTIGAGVVGVAAAATGIVGTWTTQGVDSDSQLAVISTAVAGLGIIAAGAGAGAAWYREAQFESALRKYTGEAIQTVDAKYAVQDQQLNAFRLKQYENRPLDELINLQNEFKEREALLEAMKAHDTVLEIGALADSAQDANFLNMWTFTRRWFS